MNSVISGAVIQTDFIANKPAGSALNPTDQLLELTSGGTYARITGAQLSASVAGQLALANTSQSGMLHQTSGNIGDYCGGDNLFHVLNTFTSLSAATTLTSVDTNKLLICSGGSWTLTLPAAANGLAHRLRNDMGITGTTGTITVTPPTGTIDGAATLKLLPQQECQILCDGTNWRSFGLKREVILGVQDTVSSTASQTILLPVGYRYFELHFGGMVPVASNDYLVVQLSANGGSTWLATGYYYINVYNSSATVAAASNVENGTNIIMTDPMYNGASGAGELKMTIYPGAAAQYASFVAVSGVRPQAPPPNKIYNMYGVQTGAGPMNALKYNMAAGNILSSYLTVKGVV